MSPTVADVDKLLAVVGSTLFSTSSMAARTGDHTPTKDEGVTVGVTLQDGLVVGLTLTVGVTVIVMDGVTLIVGVMEVVGVIVEVTDGLTLELDD